MQKIRRFKILGLIFGLMTILSCSAPKALEYKSFQNFRVQNLGFSTSEVRMSLEYNNPNNFSLQLKNSDLNIYIDNVFLGKSQSDSLIQIPRRADFLLPIKFNVDMQSIYKNALNTLLGKEITVRVTGKLKLGKANVFMSLPVNYESKEKFSVF